jgi:hypothetical protein
MRSGPRKESGAIAMRELREYGRRYEVCGVAEVAMPVGLPARAGQPPEAAWRLTSASGTSSALAECGGGPSARKR